jgi:hypothetical protein
MFLNLLFFGDVDVVKDYDFWNDNNDVNDVNVRLVHESCPRATNGTIGVIFLVKSIGTEIN